MSWLSRLANVLRRNAIDADLDDEIRFHLEQRTAELMRAGLPAEQARVEAERRFGNRLRAREASHDIKLSVRVESIVRDLGFGLRLWRRDKTLTAAAVVSLSLAIGACVAAFSLVDALVLRALPVRDPFSLIYVAVRTPDDTRDRLSFNYPLFAEVSAATREHAQLFAVSDQARTDAFIDGSADAEKVYGQAISGDALEILGIKPSLGRLFTPSDDVTPGQHPVAVLSYDFWTRRFNRSADVLGRSVTLRDRQLQIVGVTQKGFTGVEPGIMTDVWMPMMMWNPRAITDSSTRWLQIWGRLRSTSSAEPTRSIIQSSLTRFNRELIAAFPPDAPADQVARALNMRVALRSAARARSGLREGFERPLWMLTAVAALVLLIAGSNVAALLVARALAREREMALRMSIGAGRGRLVQQMLIESALLSVAACVVGGLFAIIVAPQVVAMLSTSRSIVRLDLRIDWLLLSFLAVAGCGMTFLFGMLPALRASEVSPHNALRTGGRLTTRSGAFRPLIAAQMAFGFVVLFIASLCLTSFVRLVRTDLGFDPDNLIVFRIESTSSSEPSTELWRLLLERVGQTPGVESASFSDWGLFEGPGRNKSIRVPGRAPDEYAPWYLAVSPQFLKTMRIPLVQGRDVEWSDLNSAEPSAVIVNESFARRYFPNQSALGQRFFRLDGSIAVAQDIVGVARDAKYTDLRELPPPTVYNIRRPAGRLAVQARTRIDPALLTARLREELPRVSPAFRLTDVTPQSTLVNNHLIRDRALAMLSAFFAIVAIVLVAVGLYGVLSYNVIQRRREIGVRLALGARRGSIVRTVLSDISVMSALGLALGALGGFSAARFVAAVLYNVDPSDALSIAASLMTLLAVCAAAASIPAWRATRLDPRTVLLYD